MVYHTPFCQFVSKKSVPLRPLVHKQSSQTKILDTILGFFFKSWEILENLRNFHFQFGYYTYRKKCLKKQEKMKVSYNISIGFVMLLIVCDSHGIFTSFMVFYHEFREFSKMFFLRKVSNSIEYFLQIRTVCCSLYNFLN